MTTDTNIKSAEQSIIFFNIVPWNNNLIFDRNKDIAAINSVKYKFCFTTYV